MTDSGRGSLLARYQAGEHEAVWAEMMALGPEVRQPLHLDDAWAVARATMRRARQNVEQLIRRLDEIEYRFWDGEREKSAGPPRRLTFGAKLIEASPLDALLAAMFEAARNLPPSQLTPAMMEQLHNIYRLSIWPYQDRALLLQGKRFPLDGEATALFDRAKKTPSGQLTPAAIEALDRVLRQAIDQAVGYWKEKGEEPPGVREKREAGERRRQKAEAADHLTVKSVFSAPGKKQVAFLKKMERKGVFLPLALRAWIEEVGGVNLAGAHPRLCFWEDGTFPGVFADPLMVVPDMFLWEIEAWQEDGGAGVAPLDAVLGWDARAKARLAVENVELDGGYAMTLPDAAADAPLKGAPHGTSFVGYLRHAFRWGGFPGWERHENRPEKELAFLADGLLPI
jgi:hypothetical protein